MCPLAVPKLQVEALALRPRRVSDVVAHNLIVEHVDFRLLDPDREVRSEVLGDPNSES